MGLIGNVSRIGSTTQNPIATFLSKVASHWNRGRCVYPGIWGPFFGTPEIQTTMKSAEITEERHPQHNFVCILALNFDILWPLMWALCSMSTCPDRSSSAFVQPEHGQKRSSVVVFVSCGFDRDGSRPDDFCFHAIVSTSSDICSIEYSMLSFENHMVQDVCWYTWIWNGLSSWDRTPSMNLLCAVDDFRIF